MIYEVEGDILLSRAQALAHGVAPGDHFDQGLALALRERFPSMVKDFRHYCHQEHPKAGTVWAWAGAGSGGGAGVRVYSLLTQESAMGKGEKPGPAHVEYVGHALRDLKKHIEKEKLQSVALPRLATGVGGLKWADVRPLIDKYLGDIPAKVYVYSTYRPGVAANE